MKDRFNKDWDMDLGDWFQFKEIVIKENGIKTSLMDKESMKEQIPNESIEVFGKKVFLLEEEKLHMKMVRIIKANSIWI